MTEADQIRQARQGDPAGWEWIVQEHQQQVFRLAYLLLGDADDAEDVAQETFIRAYRALKQFDAERSMRPWLLRITANLANNWRRSAGRYLAALQRLLRSEPSPRSIPQLAAQHMQGNLLWEAVRRLSLVDQQVIYLRYYLEISETETAQVLSIPTGTVKSRLHRALTRLRVVLEKDYPELLQEAIDV